MEPERTANQVEDARRTADIVQATDLEDALIDRRSLATAASRIDAGKHEGAAARLGEVGERAERCRHFGGQARRQSRRPGIHHVEDILGRPDRESDPATETAQSNPVIGAGGGRRVEGEEQSTAPQIELRGGIAGDGEIARRGEAADKVGRVMKHQRIDVLVAGQGQRAGEDLADIISDGERVIETRVIEGEVEGPEVAVAPGSDIGDQGVAHVRRGGWAGGGRESFADEPRRDDLVDGAGREGQPSSAGGRRSGNHHAQRIRINRDDGRPGWNPGAGDAHAGSEIIGQRERDIRATPDRITEAGRNIRDWH